MLLNVLGCWGPYPAAGAAASGYLLRSGDTKILVDLGHGAFGVLSGLIDFRELDAVFISHYHPDHCADLPALRQAIKGALKDGSRTKGLLPLYVPDQPQPDFERIQICADTFIIHPYSTIRAGKVDVGPVRVEWMPVRHAMPSMALAFQAGGRRLVYTADTAFMEELVDFARGADLLLAEASGLDKDIEFVMDNHMTARQAGELGRRSEVRWLSLTHLFPEYDVNDLKTQAGEAFGREVLTAAEVQVYDLEEDDGRQYDAAF
ncbi:MAG: MBL fold metallo-hydrolase [Bacillota bacterium]|uniref:MBL fold metallo-hydrolase n=1 Tax=unclassified Candidatus Desulforudis TaxID=2635950 RepID=UPI003487C832